MERRNGQFIVGVPNNFIAEHLKHNQLSLIERLLVEVTGEKIEPVFVTTSTGEIT